MDLDDDELNATKRAKVMWALDVLKYREDYLVPNSTLDEAIGVVVDFTKKILGNK